MAKNPKKRVSQPKVKISKKQKKTSPQSAGFRNAIAKAFPTFAKALAVKPVEGQGGTPNNKKVKPIVPMTPTINLLPVDYTIGRTISNVRRATAIAGTGIAAALGIVFLAQGAVIGIAEQAKLTVDAQVNEANLRIETFKDTAQLYSVLNERKDILESIENGRPAYYAAINELYAKLPAGAQLSAVEMEHVSLSINGNIEGEPTGVVCGPIADPFASETRPVSACITFEGSALNRADVSAYASALAESGLFSNVVVGKGPEQLGNGQRVTFSGTAAILKEIDPSVILESQPTQPPTVTQEPQIPEGEQPNIPAGVLLDPTNGGYFTEDRAYQYIPGENIYIELATRNVYGASPEDGSVDIAGGVLRTIPNNAEGSEN